MTTQVPTAATGGDDLLAPAQAMLRGLSVLPSEADVKANGPGAAFRGTPDSLSIIESGGTALSKGYAVVIALLGGGTAVTTAVTGFWQNETTSVRIVLVGGTAVFLASAVIAIAVIVSADVKGRAAGSVAQYDVRRQVAMSFLELSLAAHRDATASASQATRSGSVVWSLAVVGSGAEVVRTGNGVVGHLSGVRGGSDGNPEVQITRSSDGVKEWCSPDELQLRENTF
jgi:hypothetical protein